MDYVYGKYKKYTVKSAMVLDNLYIYFEKETKERKNGRAGQSASMGNRESNDHKAQN